jgi:hypothetical protein
MLARALDLQGRCSMSCDPHAKILVVLLGAMVSSDPL